MNEVQHEIQATLKFINHFLWGMLYPSADASRHLYYPYALFPEFTFISTVLIMSLHA